MSESMREPWPVTADLAPESRMSSRPSNDVDVSDSDGAALIAAGPREEFRVHWSQVQSSFVDEPRQAVEAGDRLVTEVIECLAQTFRDQRALLEETWARGGEASTEDLRRTLKRYRAFFDKLLSV